MFSQGAVVRSLRHSSCIDIDMAIAESAQQSLYRGSMIFGTFLLFQMSMFGTAKISCNHSLSGRPSFSMRKPFWH